MLQTGWSLDSNLKSTYLQRMLKQVTTKHMVYTSLFSRLQWLSNKSQRLRYELLIGAVNKLTLTILTSYDKFSHFIFLHSPFKSIIFTLQCVFGGGMWCYDTARPGDCSNNFNHECRSWCSDKQACFEMDRRFSNGTHHYIRGCWEQASI